jgi:hypothetical protein
MSDLLNIISLGAGKQSSYMLLNALEGKYKYKPDFAIFSDTGCEPNYVYDYLRWLRPYVWEIKIGERRIWLGAYRTAEEASNQYLNALKRFGLWDDYEYISRLLIHK